MILQFPSKNEEIFQKFVKNWIKITFLANICTAPTYFYTQAVYKGNSIGTINTESSITNTVNGTPTLTKSINLYPPGASTIVLTGEDTGVIKAAEAEIATIITNGAGE